MSIVPPAPETPPQPQPQQGAVPVAPPAPTAKKNFFARHKVLTVLGGVVALVIVISIAANAGAKSTKAEKPATGSANSQAPVEAQAEKPADTRPGLGVPVKSGDLEFTAVSVEQLGKEVGGEYLKTTAQGQFVRLNMKVSNVSDSPQTFVVNYLTLLDDQGRSYDADTTATLYAAPDSQTWIAKINPGNTVEGPVVFDLPEGVSPTALKVRGSLMSGSKEIRLQ